VGETGKKENNTTNTLVRKSAYHRGTKNIGEVSRKPRGLNTTSTRRRVGEVANKKGLGTSSKEGSRISFVFGGKVFRFFLQVELPK